jgi:hypothetical protein
MAAGAQTRPETFGDVFSAARTRTFLLRVGLMAMLEVLLGVDTTVETSSGRIHKLGLMHRSRSGAMFCGVVTLVGAILCGSGPTRTA